MIRYTLCAIFIGAAIILTFVAIGEMVKAEQVIDYISTMRFHVGAIAHLCLAMVFYAIAAEIAAADGKA